MTTSAYIIKNDTLIASVNTDLKNGSSVCYAYNKCEEAIDASRDFNLVNARIGKISRAKKWAKKSWEVESAIEINKGEFLI